MLLELRVENLLLIDRAELRLGDGLNAITGEGGSSAQLGTLGAFCGPDHVSAREEFAGAHARVLALERRLEELRSRAGASERERDLLAYELAEIESLGPDESDKVDLLAARGRLRALDGLRAAAGGGAEAIAPEGGEPGVALMLADAERLSEAVAGADPELDAFAARMRELRIEAEDLGAELRRYESVLDGDPERLQEVQERLDIYDRLERKHGGR